MYEPTGKITASSFVTNKIAKCARKGHLVMAVVVVI